METCTHIVIYIRLLSRRWNNPQYRPAGNSDASHLVMLFCSSVPKPRCNQCAKHVATIEQLRQQLIQVKGQACTGAKHCFRMRSAMWDIIKKAKACIDEYRAVEAELHALLYDIVQSHQ